ncbi:HXXEE domain-containing protein [Bacillus sp. REN10]|uniref:HXXEE domain-containing protein n=1 Tax=Bacillus sp. REN10 TaxID=2782541 RepID=UPI00193C7187|nr:HXXEE domain-containing protein [Bacillus sp. REN10]
MFTIELHNALWLFLVVFMLHDFEEIISVENWAQKTQYLVNKTKYNLSILQIKIMRQFYVAFINFKQILVMLKVDTNKETINIRFNQSETNDINSELPHQT